MHINVYDTINVYSHVYDTSKIYSNVYDTIIVNKEISITDTLIIDANLTGINPPLSHNIIKAYLNPTKYRIIINNGDYRKMSGYKLKISNSLGTIVFESLINKQMFGINLNLFSGKGTYFLQIIDNTSQIIDIKKIILQ